MYALRQPKTHRASARVFGTERKKRKRNAARNQWFLDLFARAARVRWVCFRHANRPLHLSVAKCGIDFPLTRSAAYPYGSRSSCSYLSEQKRQRSEKLTAIQHFRPGEPHPTQSTAPRPTHQTAAPPPFASLHKLIIANLTPRKKLRPAQRLPQFLLSFLSSPAPAVLTPAQRAPVHSAPACRPPP